jgi:hypothetical protein
MYEQCSTHDSVHHAACVQQHKHVCAVLQATYLHARWAPNPLMCMCCIAGNLLAGTGLGQHSPIYMHVLYCRQLASRHWVEGNTAHVGEMYALLLAYAVAHVIG